MSAREDKRRAVTASVIIISGFTLAGSALIIDDVEHARRVQSKEPESARAAVTREPVLLADRSPAPGLVRAPEPVRRRVIVVRRTRAS